MLLDRTVAPKIKDAVEFDYVLPPIQYFELDNGISLHWFSGGVQDVVAIDWVFPAGLWNEEKEAVTQAVAALMKNGTSTKSAHTINESLEFYGASLKVNTGNDYGTLSLYTLTKHLPHLLPIVFEILTDAAFPENELALHQQNSIQKLLVHLRHCDFVANQKIDAMLFGEHHPYGRFSKQASIEALTRTDLIDYHQTLYNLAHVRMFMTGKVGERELNNINQVFGKKAIQKNDIKTKSFEHHLFQATKQYIANDPNGVQGAIRIGRLFPNRHHPDFAPMIVLNTLFGGYFGSRLMSNIREEKGFTYGIYSSISPYVHSGAFTIHTEVGKDVIEPALKEIYFEMNTLCEHLVDEEELLLVKNYLLGNLLGDLDGPIQIMQRWRMLLLNGLNVENFNRNIQIYKSITAKELQTLAQKYLQPKDYIEIVVV